VRSLRAIVATGRELTELDFVRYFEYFALPWMRLLFDKTGSEGLGEPCIIPPFSLLGDDFFISGARASFWVPAVGGRSLRLLAGCAPTKEMFGRDELRIDSSVAGQSMQEGKVLVWPSDTAIRVHSPRTSAEDAYKAFACFPVPSIIGEHGANHPYGVFCVDAKNPDVLRGDETIIWLRFFADVIVDSAAKQILGQDTLRDFMDRMQNKRPRTDNTYSI